MTPDDSGRLLRVAAVLGAHGIRGDVKLRSFMSEPEAVSTHGPLLSAAGERFEIIKLKASGRDFIVSFKGVEDRNRAETLKGVALFLPREKLPTPEEGEVYASDLIGLPVLLKDGSRFGEIVDVPNFGAGDLLEIRPAERKDTVLVPFASSYVVQRDGERVVIDLPEGYLDDGE